MNKRIFTLIALSLFCSEIAYAEKPRWFEIEMFLFKRDTSIDENWPDPKIESSGKPRFDFLTAPTELERQGYMLYAKNKPRTFYLEDSPFLLNKKAFTFTKRIQVLKKHNDIEPLLHMVWKQGIRDQNTSQPIQITLGENFSDRYRPNGYTISDTENLTTQAQKIVREISGYLDIYINQYIYLDLNLVLRREESKSVKEFDTLSELTPQGGSSSYSFLQYIPFQQKKRIRSGELHYFDHPYLGMIIEVRRIKKQPKN
tara:strand:- start:5748 stop:6518 length:771 start_codon:yes stop_codon:yes gene_type:complete